jgi:hypothetical protein
MRKLILLVAAGLALASCDLSSGEGSETGAGEGPARSGAFAHGQSDDISGYYRPAGAIGAAGLELRQVFIGQEAEFQAWEKGERSTTFAPVMMEFAQAGGGTVRVLPDRYSVNDDRVSMRGTAPGVGEVSFDARLNQGALSTARRNLGGAEEPAMTGVVTVGGRSVSGVKFSWYGGD